MKTLVIVESPTKAKTIKRFLGSGYQIESSNGHLRDLPKGELVRFDWSPLGDQIAFSFRFRKADSYIIRNVLPQDKK